MRLKKLLSFLLLLITLNVAFAVEYCHDGTNYGDTRPCQNPATNPYVPFYDSFENGLDHWSQRHGRTRNAGGFSVSTNYTRTGTSSAVTSEPDHMIAYDPEDIESDKMFECWFYDDLATDHASLCGVLYEAADYMDSIMAGTETYINQNYYTYHVCNSPYACYNYNTSISRTEGWHQVVVTNQNETNKVYLDEYLIVNTTQVPNWRYVFAKVNNGTHTNFPVAYFDDLKISFFNGTLPFSCQENWIANYGSCTTNDIKIKYYVDANSCERTNFFPSDNNTEVSCDYCTPIQNTTYTSWNDQESCRTDDLKYQRRSRIYYDGNYCYDQTGLASDIYTNTTIYEYQNVTCDYCLPNWTCNSYNSTGHCIEAVDNNDCFNQTGLATDQYFGDYTEFPIFESVTGSLTGNKTAEIENQTTFMNSTAKVTIKKAGTRTAEFNFNFSGGNQLDLSNITTTDGTTGASKVYLLINGVQQAGTKTIYLYNASNNYNWICIKDTIVSDVSEISSNCQGTNEHHIQCNGVTSSSYTCTNNNGILIVTGLQHSGVVQIEAPASTPTSSGSGNGGGGGYYKPKNQTTTVSLSETTACVSTNLTCIDWNKCVGETQTRTCTDNCGKMISDMRTCETIKEISMLVETEQNIMTTDSNTNQSKQPNAITGGAIVSTEKLSTGKRILISVVSVIAATCLVAGLIYAKYRGKRRLELKNKEKK